MISDRVMVFNLMEYHGMSIILSWLGRIEQRGIFSDIFIYLYVENKNMIILEFVHFVSNYLV